jgi:hypothetical protein
MPDRYDNPDDPTCVNCGCEYDADCEAAGLHFPIGESQRWLAQDYGSPQE